MHRPVHAEVKVLDRAFGGMEAGQLMLISTDLPPVWRVIDITSPLAKKLPLGLLVLISEQQSQEGLHV